MFTVQRFGVKNWKMFKNALPNLILSVKGVVGWGILLVQIPHYRWHAISYPNSGLECTVMNSMEKTTCTEITKRNNL